MGKEKEMAEAVAEVIFIRFWVLTGLLLCSEESHPSCVQPPR